VRGVGGERRNHGRRYYVYVRGGCLWARMPGDHVSRLLLLDPSGGSAERIRGATVLVLGVGGPGGSGREYVAELHFVGLSTPVIGGEPGFIASVETAAVVRGARGGGGRSVTLVALGCGIPGLVPLADEHRDGDGGEDADDDHEPYRCQSTRHARATIQRPAGQRTPELKLTLVWALRGEAPRNLFHARTRQSTK
jgi:hypothetical protein